VSEIAAPELQRTLKARHMQMIALGGVIGAGLFVGSGVVIQATGPAAVLSFAITGLLVVLVMRMLGEMASAYPSVGGFYEYNRLALGELAGFMTGWMYWYFWIIVVALEAVAGARLLLYWYPGVAPWRFTLGLMTLFTLLNLLSVRSWGETEYWFASIKVAAIVVFLGVGLVTTLGLWPGVSGGIANLTSHGGFLPMGIVPVLTGAVAATGFYFGSEIVTVAAAESAEPELAVAKAHPIRRLPRSGVLCGLYFGRGDFGPVECARDFTALRHRTRSGPCAGRGTDHERRHSDRRPLRPQQRPVRFFTDDDGPRSAGRCPPCDRPSQWARRAGTRHPDQHRIRLCRRPHELRIARAYIFIFGRLVRNRRHLRVSLDRMRTATPASQAGA
jgi:hypothetical protein